LNNRKPIEVSKKVLARCGSYIRVYAEEIPLSISARERRFPLYHLFEELSLREFHVSPQILTESGGQEPQKDSIIQCSVIIWRMLSF
jgi:hypothetical protein